MILKLPIVFLLWLYLWAKILPQFCVSVFSSSLFRFPSISLQEFTRHTHQSTWASTSASTTLHIHFQRHFRSGIYRTLF